MEKIIREYRNKKREIKKRLSEFKRFYNEPMSWFYENNEMKLKEVSKGDNKRIFEELCFCILTANGTAVSGMKAIDASRDFLIKGNKKEIQEKLKKSGVRFHNRAEYITENREKFKRDYGFNFKKIIDNYKDKKELRDFFVKNVKGFGYKEASHFLRNIGISGLAILDKHILRTMQEYLIISEVPKSLNRERYLTYEKKFIEFSKKLNINIDELDLLLWSMKNGQIMK